jgi:hypothetical protein
MIEDLKPLIQKFADLQKEAYQAYKPQAERLNNSQITDENVIQRTLDFMLDFCGDSEMLLLYKKLCRYYWDINPQATAYYINQYREMWDDDKN